jgi:hypothetical protein
VSRSVQLQLFALPLEANLSVDGKAISGNPVVLEVPRDQKPHEIRAFSPGYVPTVKTIRFDRDLSLEIALQKVSVDPAATASVNRSAVPRPGRPGIAHGPVRVPPKVEATPAPCDPPFYFENGIKLYKPGCL